MKRKCCKNIEISFTNYINVYYTSILYNATINRNKLSSFNKLCNSTKIHEQVCKILKEKTDDDELIKKLIEYRDILEGGAIYEMKGGGKYEIIEALIKVISKGGNLYEFKKAYIAKVLEYTKKSLDSGTFDEKKYNDIIVEAEKEVPKKVYVKQVTVETEAEAVEAETTEATKAVAKIEAKVEAKAEVEEAKAAEVEEAKAAEAEAVEAETTEAVAKVEAKAEVEEAEAAEVEEAKAAEAETEAETEAEVEVMIQKRESIGNIMLKNYFDKFQAETDEDKESKIFDKIGEANEAVNYAPEILTDDLIAEAEQKIESARKMYSTAKTMYSTAKTINKIKFEAIKNALNILDISNAINKAIIAVKNANDNKTKSMIDKANTNIKTATTMFFEAEKHTYDKEIFKAMVKKLKEAIDNNKQHDIDKTKTNGIGVGNKYKKYKHKYLALKAKLNM